MRDLNYWITSWDPWQLEQRPIFERTVILFTENEQMSGKEGDLEFEWELRIEKGVNVNCH